MIYPENFEQKLGFIQIRNFLKEECLSILGENFVDKINFSSDYKEITTLLNQTEEFKNILLLEDSFPAQDYYDLSEELNRIKTPGTYIEQAELNSLKLSLSTISEILNFIKKRGEEKYPYLLDICDGIFVEKTIIFKIAAIVNNKGEIKDNASENLKKIRKQIISKHRDIDNKIKSNLTNAKKQGWIKQDVSITIRNGRSVIPMPASNKNIIKGFIHDESATGQTVYIEPTEIFDINNELQELIYIEKREIIKILTAFTNFIRPYIPDLKEAYNFLGIIDFIRAKAKFAIKINAVKPLLENKSFLEWRDAKHPLLYLSHKAQNKKIIPLNIKLETNNRILIISGPNAGGKSVCLKTIGLLQYMIQSGLLIPLKKNSITGIFKKIFIDIGDEQSLENDLSTYSSHLINIKNFILKCDKESLFLIDEFGTGTEPNLGGAIAEAVLEKLNNLNSYGVVTTHYSNLKLLAEKNQGIINGAMLFDTKKLQPLFMLKIGNPGSSFAFEIANKIGFPKEILDNAAKKTGKTQLNFDKQLQNLEVEKKELETKQDKVKLADDLLSEVLKKYQTLTNSLEDSKKNIILEAQNQAQQIIKDSNKLIEKTIKEIKENSAEKEKTKTIRKELSEFSENIRINKNSSKKSVKEKLIKPLDKTISKGDYVKLKEQDIIGIVESINQEQISIAFNSIKLKTTKDSVEKISRKEAKSKIKKTQSKINNSIYNSINEKAANFKLSIDVRGKKVDECLSLISKYIDDALLLNIKEIRIIHGKGFGILYKVIRDFLRDFEQIESFEDEDIKRGGHGITIVKFK